MFQLSQLMKALMVCHRRLPSCDQQHRTRTLRTVHYKPPIQNDIYLPLNRPPHPLHHHHQPRTALLGKIQILNLLIEVILGKILLPRLNIVCMCLVCFGLT
eukprot:Lithocolla_globosa_v1_NODE_1294_length_2695_cov_6.288258.p5 type:complete len:101 gc:universal NODE_1294_length_2695_cov_6.288258:2003-1701(-)